MFNKIIYLSLVSVSVLGLVSCAKSNPETTTTTVATTTKTAEAQAKEVPIEKMFWSKSYQNQHWEVHIPNSNDWHIASKDAPGSVNTVVYLPKKQSFRNWTENITQSYLSEDATGNRSLEDMVTQAENAAKKTCETVNWQVVSKDNTSIVYTANSINCGKKKYSQHLVGRMEKGKDGLYSLQYFANDKIYNEEYSQQMLNTVTGAKLVDDKIVIEEKQPKA